MIIKPSGMSHACLIQIPQQVSFFAWPSSSSMTSLTAMPCTRASQSNDSSALENIGAMHSKIDLHIFFKYYDGFTDGGTIGFVIDKGANGGSMKHYIGEIPLCLTRSQFWGKAKKLAMLAETIFRKVEHPPPEVHPQFDPQEIAAWKEQNCDKRITAKKFAEIEDKTEFLVFLNYYNRCKNR